MTYEEAKQMEREILKNSIRYRLYKYNPIKYAHFKPSKEILSIDRIMEIWQMVKTIKNHEQGNPFERDDIFFKSLNRGIK